MPAALGKHRAYGSACRSCRTGLSMGKRRLGALTAQRAVFMYAVDGSALTSEPRCRSAQDVVQKFPSAADCREFRHTTAPA